jgi:hypothetical protein
VSSNATEYPMGSHWKHRFEKEIGVTGSWEVPEFREFEDGLAEWGFLYLEMFDLKIQG